MKNVYWVILIFILILASVLRFYGLNWDQNQHLHPDERFLTMVVNALGWPQNITQYFDTQISPLNPQNRGFNFFVYGTFPIFFTKLLSDLFHFNDYNNFTLFGRAVSGVFELLTIFFIFSIGTKIFSKKVGLIAALLYSISVLPIQLAHFFAVDTFLNFFIVATFYFLILLDEKLTQAVHNTNTKKIMKLTKLSILAGINFGLAFASKISAVLFIPTIGVFFLYLFFKKKFIIFIPLIIFSLSMFFTFRIFQPYAFLNSSIFDPTLNPKFIANLEEIRIQSQPNIYFPPAVQWIDTTPIFYPLRDILLWGLGLPLGSVTLLAIFIFSVRLSKVLLVKKLNCLKIEQKQWLIFLILLTIASTFFYQSTQFAKPMRYFLPIYPFLAILTASFSVEVFSYLKSKFSPPLNFIFSIIYFFFFALWPISFMAIYTKPHTRIAASEWIYQNIPHGAKLAEEHWDDGLPLNLPKHSVSIYQWLEFPLFGQDSKEKWEIMKEKLSNVDYIILSSNRLYGSIGRLPKIYPLTSAYYKTLFEGNLGFKKVAEFASRPNLPLPIGPFCLTPSITTYGSLSEPSQECTNYGINFVDDYADETFTVYDHPKVIIFKKVNP